MNALRLIKTLCHQLGRLHLSPILIHGISLVFYYYFKLRNNLKIINLKYLPSKNNPRFILIGNHSSGADSYLLLSIMTGRFLRRIYAVVHEKAFRHETLERILLELFQMIPRNGTGQQIVNRMVKELFQNRTIAIPPEGMTNEKIMKGYTGIMRVYWLVNHINQKKKYQPKPIPIIPAVTIGANQAYPITWGSDGKYHKKKTQIIIRLGKPINFILPDHPDKRWFREQTNLLMDKIAIMALQKEGAIESWKLDSLTRNQPRIYK